MAIAQQPVVVIEGVRYHVHTVAAGQTIYSLAKAYGVTEQAIIEANPILSEGLKADQNIKIPVAVPAVGEREKLSAKQLKKTFDQHTVGEGETFYAIARRYEISVETLMEDNPEVDPLQLPIGTELLIRKKAVGKTDGEQIEEAWQEYNDQLDSVAPQEEPEAEVQPADTIRWVDFRALPAGETLRVALLLPMTGGGRGNHPYVDFYQGFLLGLDKVKSQYGHPVRVDLFDTTQEGAQIDTILMDSDFRAAHLVVGPVYEAHLPAVVAYAEEHGIPVVSPLVDLKTAGSDVLFQMTPPPSNKQERLEELFRGEKQITLIYGQTNDREFEQEVLAALGELPRTQQNYRFGIKSSESAIQSLLTNGRDNMVVVLSDNNIETDRILSAFSSFTERLVGRGYRAPRLTIIGNPLWNRREFDNIDRTLFFKTRVVMLSNYHAKRDAAVVRAFDRDFIRAFGELPTPFAYRGYDAAMIFVPAMYADIQYDMEGRNYTPLQTTYTFEQPEGRRNHTNQKWMRVTYNPNFTITVD